MWITVNSNFRLWVNCIQFTLEFSNTEAYKHDVSGLETREYFKQQIHGESLQKLTKNIILLVLYIRINGLLK